MEKVAIIGLSCLFPDAETPEQFWQNLINQKDSISDATSDQMGVDPDVFFEPIKGKTGETGKYYCKRGGFIKNFRFDPVGYRISPEILTSLDYIFQWALYVSKQALLDSGYLGNDEKLARCGLILGNLSSPTRSSYRLLAPLYQRTLDSGLQVLFNQPQFQLKNLPSSHALSVLNIFTSGYPSAIAAQALGLGGIHFSLDAACASALYAVKLACNYLLAGKTDLMLAGAISCTDPFMTHTAFSLFQAYSEDGVSRPLDISTGGLMTGEGAGMLALKRYSDALRDGDRIYATICGLGLSNDGRGKHFLSPNPRGQILAYERAYAEAGIDPKLIDYVECHGTGTPLGDPTELNSMDAFFGVHGGKPKVGSVKSNIGHLLTAAGMPSMLKVILSMNAGMIPPTLHVQDPLGSENYVIAPEQVVRTMTPWTTPVKYAGVSSFGFGGTNSHLILEHKPAAIAASGSDLTPAQSSPKLAIIGIDAFFGECKSLDAFDRCLYEGSQQFIPLPKQRWRGFEQQTRLLEDVGIPEAKAPLGAYIKEFDLDYLRFRMPPDPSDQPIPQQLLLLKVADNALRHAKITEGAKVAVVVAMGTELASHQIRARCDWLWQGEDALARAGITLPPDKKKELEDILRDSIQKGTVQVNQCISFIGNIMASRVAAVWDFTGPTFTVSAEENSVFKALEVAQLLLTDPNLDAVLVGSVDLAGGGENVMPRSRIAPLNTGVPTLSLDEASNGWMVGEGAGAVVLKRLEDAKDQQNCIYAVIDAISLVQDHTPPSTAIPYELPLPTRSHLVTQTCQEALQKAGMHPSDVTYLELFGSGIEAEDTAEMQGLIRVYQNAGTPLTCAIGSVKANIGHTYAASGMASLIKTALCLFHRYIPATPNWSRPKQFELWQGTPFYVPTDSRPWSLEDMTLKRVAAINGLGIDRTYAHIILSEEVSVQERDSGYLQQTPMSLFPIAANTRSELFEQLTLLQQMIERSTSLKTAAAQTFESFCNCSDRAYVAAIVGRDRVEVLRELQRAEAGIAKAFDQEQDWKTPLGSYFTANPLGKTGGVAYVYPGAFTSYLGVARDAYRLVPKTYDNVAYIGETPALQKLLHQTNHVLYPRSLSALTSRQLETLEAELMENANIMLVAGMMSAVTITSVMQDCFGLKPCSSFGYSLGELSMLMALKVWLDMGEMHSSTHSELFKTRLSGPKNAVRELWGVPLSQKTPEAQEAPDEDFWATYVVIKPAIEVIEALQQESRVYLTHINTPEEVVIAGDAEACLRLIQHWQCNHFRAPASHVLHCEPTRLEYDEFVKWHTLPVQPIDGIRFYSAADDAPVRFDTHSIAHNIAKALCQPVDFPRLINRAYQDGARIFLEMGPGGTCSRWIRETLKQQPHVAIPTNIRGMDDRTALIRVLAQLVSHQVPVDLFPLYEYTLAQKPKGRSLVKTVIPGGNNIKDAILTEEAIQRFAEYRFPATVKHPPAVYPPLFPGPKPPIKHEDVFVPQRQPVTANGMEADVVEPVLAMSAAINTSTNPSPPPDDASWVPMSQCSSLYETLSSNRAHSAQVHRSFLQFRQESLHQIQQLIQLQLSAHRLAGPGAAHTSISSVEEPSRPERSQIAETTGSVEIRNSTDQPLQTVIASPPAYASISPPIYSTGSIVFNEADVLEFAEGKIARVFGPDYGMIDTYPRRVRLPMPPYLFISRVTQMEAKRGVFEPCWIETEFDVPESPWSLPCGAFIEACHGNMILISYLGIDFEIQGKRVYRALDGISTFVGQIPRSGETMRCRVQINSFVRSGETLLYFYTFESFVGDRKFLEAKGGAGFFTDDELKKAPGVTFTEREKAERRQIQPRSFQPLLHCTKTSFNENDLEHLSMGNFAACFGPQYDQQERNPALLLPTRMMRLFDRIISIDTQGGAYGLGLIVAEKDLNPEHWYFNCHFKGDYCLPGTLIGEGCSQALVLYLFYLGLQTRTRNAYLHPILNMTQTGRSRGQVTPTTGKLTYEIEVTEIGLEPTPYIKADANVIFNGKVISFIKNLGTQLFEFEE